MTDPSVPVRPGKPVALHRRTEAVTAPNRGGQSDRPPDGDTDPHPSAGTDRQKPCILIPAGHGALLDELPPDIECIAVVSVEIEGLLCVPEAGRAVLRRFAPLPCLGLFATGDTLAPMGEVREWLIRSGVNDPPEVVSLDGLGEGAAERVLLSRLLDQNRVLARLAAEHTRHLAALRAAYDTLAAARAEMDRFLGDTGLARLVCIFSTAEPDYETQIEVAPDAMFRQLLPVASSGLAALDLACAAAPHATAPLRVRLDLVEEDRTLAEWRVPPPAADGWIRLGLPTAYAGLNRTLSLSVEAGAPDVPCLHLALSGYQPLVAAQLKDATSGESIAPHSLAMRIFAALPGTSPPHGPDTILPRDETPPPIQPYALRAVPRGALDEASLTADRHDPPSRTPGLLQLPEAEAIAIRPGATVRLPDLCPPGSRGVIVTLALQASAPTSITVDLWAGESRDETSPSARAHLHDGAAQDLSVLLAEPAAAACPIHVTATDSGGGTVEAAWVIVSNPRAYV